MLCIVLMFSVMNGTMFMVAVPDIAETFSLLPSQVSWVVTGYIIFYAIGALIYGKLADLYPLKRLLAIGLILFALGSVVGFLAPNYIIVVAGRMIQAMGASAIPALVFIVPSRYFPKEKGMVMGIISSTMAFASGVGPVAGGLISGVLSWKYLFLISTLVVLTIPFFWRWMPQEEQKSGKVDIPGALLMAAGVASFILFITLLMWPYLIVSMLVLSCFIWRIRKAREPFIHPSFFANVPFRTTVLCGFLGIVTMFSMMFMLPLFLSEMNGLSTVSIGLVMFPGAMGAALVGRWAGRLTDHSGSVRVVYLALGLMSTGFLLLSSFVGSAPSVISLVLIISYIAFPFLQTSTASLISNVLPRQKIGVGMGIYNLCNFISGAFGGAVIGKILDYPYDGPKFNPLALAQGDAVIYSNLFLGLLVVTLMNGFIFWIVFRRHSAIQA